MNFLNFFSKDKEYISCEELEYGIHFDVTGLFHCATYFHSDKNNEPVMLLTGNLDADYKNFLKQKDTDKKSHRNGKIVERCQNCFQLKCKKWDNSKLIKRIGIAANRKCYSQCMYCVQGTHRKENDKIKDLPVYDFIKNLFDKNLISPECVVQIAGGEPVLHFEFNELMKLFLESLSTRITIYTSGIVYNKWIETRG